MCVFVCVFRCNLTGGSPCSPFGLGHQLKARDRRDGHREVPLYRLGAFGLGFAEDDRAIEGKRVRKLERYLRR